MFSSLLRRPRAGPRRVDRRRNSSPSPSPGPARRRYTLERHATADFTEADDDDADDSHDEGMARFHSNDRHVDDDGDEEDDQDDGQDEDGRRRGGLPVLPLFSASHLGAYPQLVARMVILTSILTVVQIHFLYTA